MKSSLRVQLLFAAFFAAALFVSLTASTAQAVVIFDWVTVGDPGNAADQLYTNNNPGNLLFGSVPYTYRISKYEVTNAQYTEFLNKVAVTDDNSLFSPPMGFAATGGITRSGFSGSYTYAVKPNMGNKPVNNVSFFDVMRFINWMENGQPTGLQTAATTEAGVYTIGTGLNETRATGASFFLPSENEWYKAAYHHPAALGGDSDDYWLHATRSNAAPTIATANATGDISNPGVNVANYFSGADWNSQDGNVTTVGSAGLLSESFYGTSDQGGNVLEWNEAIIGSSRGKRGGFYGLSSPFLVASTRMSGFPIGESSDSGFRVASLFSEPAPPSTPWVPEPSTLVLLGLGAFGLLSSNRRRNRDSRTASTAFAFRGCR